MDDLHQVTRVVVECFYPLCDERRKDCCFFGFGHLAVNAGRKHDTDLVRSGPVGDQAADDKIDDLPAADSPRRVRHDDKNGLAGVNNFFERSRINWTIELRSKLEIRQSRPLDPAAE